MSVHKVQQGPCHGQCLAVHQLCYSRNVVSTCWHSMHMDSPQRKFWVTTALQVLVRPTSPAQVQCIDTYQALLAQIEEQGNDLALYFNLAAWLMLHMVSAHAVPETASCRAQGAVARELLQRVCVVVASACKMLCILLF